MFLPPPRPSLSNPGARWSVGQPGQTTEPEQTTEPAPAAQSDADEKTLTQIRTLVSKSGGPPQSGWSAFWTGMWGWLRGASGELITAGATVFITLYARELYAQARVPGQQAARVALDLATPQTEIEKMAMGELDTEADKLIADFYADDPPSNMDLGQRLQVVLELLMKKKVENLESINEAIEEAVEYGDDAIVERETAKGEGLAVEIEEIEGEWDEVTEHVAALMHEQTSVEKFHQIQEKRA